MDNLAMDIARGQGEYLNTLAVLLEVPEKRMKEHVSIPSFRHISPTFTPLLLSPTSTF
jgi:hypothetical protein